MDFKNNGNFFSKYALTICKVIFACLAVSVVGIGILALVHKGSSSRIQDNTTQQVTASADSDSSTDSTAKQEVDPNIRDYVESSSGLSDLADSTEDGDSDDGDSNDSRTDDSDSSNTGSDRTNPDNANSPDADDTPNEDADSSEDTTDNTDADSKNNAGTTSDNDEEEPAVSEEIQEIIDSMTLEEKVAQLFLITPEQLTGVSYVIQAGDPTKQALADYPVGGLIYFENNIKTEEQLKGMLANTKTYSKIPLFLGVDEEGGRVARIGNSDIEVQTFNDMLSIGQTQSASEARTVGTTIGGYLADLGFNLDFAPVTDVVSDPENASIGTRSFGGDPELVADMATAVAVGLKSQGINACMKHFPGLGDSSADTHSGTVTIEKTLEELAQSDLLPYEAGIEQGVNFIMVGHGSYPNVTGDNTPASMSSAIITDLLRNQMGYNGIVITDALNMGAIANNYTPAEAALSVINAGGDMLLMPDDFNEAYQGLLLAVTKGNLTEKRINESLARILTLKYEE